MAARKTKATKASDVSKSRPKPQRVPRSAAKPVATSDDGQRDFLVVFEEPDPYGLPTDDALILDIETNLPKRGQVDVQQKLDLELTNTTSRLGTFGFAISCLGAVLGLVLLLTFALAYPEQWYDAGGSIQGNVVVKSLIPLAILDILLLVAGTILTHYGRRIQARGNLNEVRLIEREPVASPRLE